MTDINDVIIAVATIVASLIPLVVGLAVLFFLWGLLKFIIHADNAEMRSGARRHMLWGVIIIFVMVSLWGLVNLLDDTLGLDNDPPILPSL